MLTITKSCLNHEFPRWQLKNYHARTIFVFLHGPTIWKVMPRNVWNDVVNWQIRRLNNSTMCLVPALMTHHSKEEELKSVGELSNTCSQIVLTCLYVSRIGRPDVLWSVNKLAQSIAKWTKACDKRLSPLISYIHRTCEYKQYSHVGNTAKQCRLGLFQESDFAGDLEDLKSTCGGTLCVFGSDIFVPMSWMCKKQTAISHSSTESEIISLDTGLRLDGLPALELWDPIVSVLGNVSRVSDGSGQPDSDVHKRHLPHKKIDVMKDIDSVPSNVQTARQEALSCDQDHQGKKLLQWDMFPEPTELRLFGCSIESIWTPKSKSNTLTPKTNMQTCWQEEISHVMSGTIFCVCLTLVISVLWSVLKWCRKNATRSRWRKSHSKIEVDDEFDLAMQRKDSCRATFYCIRKLVKIRHENQSPLSMQTEKYDRTETPVVHAHSSSCSEWNIDKTLSSQEWKSDELMEDRTGRPVVNAQHSDRFIVDDNDMDSNTVTESDLSLKSRSFLHPVNDQVRKRQNQSSMDATKDSDKNSVIWGCFCLPHCKHLYSWERITQTIYIPSKIQKISQWNRCSKLITEQPDEIFGMSAINWEHSSRKYLSLVGDEQVISLWHTKVDVFSDSVLCLGKMNEKPQSNYAREDRLTWFKSSSETRTLDRIDGEPKEFEWNIFPGFTTLQLRDWAQHQRIFTERIFFMSKLNDISWGCKDNKKECESNAQLVSLSLNAKRFGAGQWWTWIREKMVLYLWRQSTRRMGQNCRANPARGQLKSKGGGKLSIHYCADPGTIETVCRTIISVN